MNKRIEKLFNEAGFHKPEAERLGIEDKFEKFAELIVRECAKVAEQWYSDYPKDDRLVSECIMETFGVKNDND